MALDRQSIEKKDFPIGRQGYAPEAVDAHLTTIAAEIEAAERVSERRGAGSLASSASAQVQAIVEAAEASAAEIEREAQDEAAQIRQDAARDAQRTRDEAVQRSQEHVGKVGQATALMMQRVDAMENELAALVESLRTGANRLNADLSLLEGNMGDLYAAAGHPAGAAPLVPVVEEEIVVAAAVPQPAVADEVVAEAEAEDDAGADGELAAIVEADMDSSDLEGDDAEPDAEGGVDDVEGGEDDVEGARLIALNMALNGQSREETDRYLEENFDLGDRRALLDEVYSTVEG